MRKVMSIVGTRPELIKMCRVIALLDIQCRHILVHTGQNFDYALNEVFFHDLEIRAPDYYLGAAGETAIKTIADEAVARCPGIRHVVVAKRTGQEVPMQPGRDHYLHELLFANGELWISTDVGKTRESSAA